MIVKGRIYIYISFFKGQIFLKGLRRRALEKTVLGLSKDTPTLGCPQEGADVLRQLLEPEKNAHSEVLTVLVGKRRYLR